LKRNLATRLAIAGLAAALAAAAGCSEKDDRPTQGGAPTVIVGARAELIAVEAETGEAESPVRVIRDSGASGSGCIEVPEGAGKPASEDEVLGRAVYRDVTVPKSGEYRLHCRVSWWDQCGNSFKFVFDPGTPAERVVLVEDPNCMPLGVFGEWHWSKPRKVKLDAGPHVVEVRNKEDGVRLDGFVLTLDRTFVPQGIKPLADRRESSDTRAEPGA
jgi:hypothetical protein